MHRNFSSVLGTPYWSFRAAAPRQYPWLDRDEHCEVAVVGGGVAGLLCAYRFAQAGVRTMLLSGNPVGYGASAASQGVVSYQASLGLTGLAGKVGMDGAVRVFEMCAAAVDELEALSGELPGDIAFARRDSVNFTQDSAELETLRQEYLARRHNGFAVDLLEEESAREKMSFPVRAAIFGSALAAQCDPYALCHACAAGIETFGGQVYENTPADEILCERGGCTLHTRTGRTVRADMVILAAGEETARRLSGIAGERTDFSVVTAPVADFAGWPGQALITQFGNPGVWMRTTPESRIIASGLSCGMASLQKLSAMLNVEVFMKKKTGELLERLRAMFPGIRDIRAEYRYAMNYVTTVDGLPVLGPDAEDTLYYCLCTGENGLAYALFGSRMLLEQYQGKEPDLSLFSPDR